MGSFTVCALFFGDYPKLAARCLRSLAGLPDAVKFRIGANELSASSQAVIDDFCEAREVELVAGSRDNIHKYPMMRKLLHSQPITTDYVMWFDDDSYISVNKKYEWLAAIDLHMETHDLIGSLYLMRLQGNQHKWIESQPWYNHKPVPPLHEVNFATGGWWVCRTRLLEKYDWPVPELDHRGGDVMLGELARQQNWRLGHWSAGVAINADNFGQESKAPRRGFNSPPIGRDYSPVK